MKQEMKITVNITSRIELETLPSRNQRPTVRRPAHATAKMKKARPTKPKWTRSSQKALWKDSLVPNALESFSLRVWAMPVIGFQKPSMPTPNQGCSAETRSAASQMAVRPVREESLPTRARKSSTIVLFGIDSTMMATMSASAANKASVVERMCRTCDTLPQTTLTMISRALPTTAKTSDVAEPAMYWKRKATGTKTSAISRSGSGSSSFRKVPSDTRMTIIMWKARLFFWA